MKTPWPERVLIIGGDTPHDWFTADELSTADSFKLEKRRHEWLLSRIAAKQLAMQMGLASDPRRIVVSRPTLLIDGSETGWHVSLSHSAPYAGAAIAREPIGLDIQVLRDFPPSAAHLFLSDEEAQAMERCTLAHGILHFWCAKEAAWKRQQGEIPTLKRVPLRMIDQRESGLLFDAAETLAMDDLIVALTRALTPPTS